MACGSCGGGNRRAMVNPVQVAAGVEAPVYKARYVWRWVSKDRSEQKDFETQNEAEAHVVQFAGSLSVVDSNSR